jgi:N-carbamoyl-L-amino-acid hydrolase
MVSQTLTAESTNEQGKAGLTDCTPEEFARIQQLNADYNAKASAGPSSWRCAARAAPG